MPIKKPARREQQNSHLRPFALPDGDLPALSVLKSELMDMWDVLMGRQEPPVPARRVDALMEVADAYFARASYVTAMIQRAEQEGNLERGSAYVKFRTGELRTFLDTAKRAAELGSRRVTVRGQDIEAARLGRDSRSDPGR